MIPTFPFGKTSGRGQNELNDNDNVISNRQSKAEFRGSLGSTPWGDGPLRTFRKLQSRRTRVFILVLLEDLALRQQLAVLKQASQTPDWSG
jgi:hypothetical protein